MGGGVTHTLLQADSLALICCMMLSKLFSLPGPQFTCGGPLPVVSLSLALVSKWQGSGRELGAAQPCSWSRLGERMPSVPTSRWTKLPNKPALSPCSHSCNSLLPRMAFLLLSLLNTALKMEPKRHLFREAFLMVPHVPAEPAETSPTPCISSGNIRKRIVGLPSLSFWKAKPIWFAHTLASVHRMHAWVNE